MPTSHEVFLSQFHPCYLEQLFFIMVASPPDRNSDADYVLARGQTFTGLGHKDLAVRQLAVVSNMPVTLQLKVESS